MTAKEPLRVTAILAVHNEEKLVRDCLTSLAAVADEILVAHDGPCRDRSIEIAREFTPHVWVHEWRGAPETNLIRLLRRASHDWVIRLDCDETFSPDLIQRLQDIKARGGEDGIVHYLAIWRAVYGSNDRTAARAYEVPARTVMFRKSRARWFGIPHAPMEVSGPSVGLRECVYHHAPHQHFGMLELVTRKMYPFSKVDAALRLKYPIDTIGYDGCEIEDIIRPIDRLRAERPLLVGGPLAALSGARAFKSAFRAGTPTEFVRNLRWPVVHGSYQLMLAWHLHLLRSKGFTARLATMQQEPPKADAQDAASAL